MDKILEGLLSSSHPLPVKRSVVKKVLEAAEGKLDGEQCQAMFTLATRLTLLSEDTFQRQVGQQVLDAYARCHRAQFGEFFNSELVLGMLRQGYGSLGRRDARLLDFVQHGLRLSLSLPSVLAVYASLRSEALRMVCERLQPSTACRLGELLIEFPQCLPREGQQAIVFCKQLVRTIGHFVCPAAAAEGDGADSEKAIREFIGQVNRVSGLLPKVWVSEPAALLPSLQEVFAIISTPDVPADPSIALASLVQYIPLQMTNVIIHSLTTDANVHDANMMVALCRMIDWLSWPLAQRVDCWVTALLKGLAAVNKFTILIDVTVLKIEQVLSRLWFPVVRAGALSVLSHMLLSFQHSPEAFHLLLPHMPGLVTDLRKEASPTSMACLRQLSRLMQCMMYQYSGFPDLYEPILELFKDFPLLHEDDIKRTLTRSAWTSQRSASPTGPLRRAADRSETGRTGLVNLGNTCYMNSIIQALFMTTHFRRAVLSLSLNGSRPLMGKLQLLFAFLAHTQRSAFEPRNFLEVSRPPWFTPGSQQDCSEYLKYLLTRIHEEEKTLIQLHRNAKAAKQGAESSGILLTETQSASGNPQDCKKTGADALESPKEVSEKDEERTLVEKMFGGKLLTRISCKNCRGVSERFEAFTDLSLAFPTQGVESAGKLDSTATTVQPVTSSHLANEISSVPNVTQHSALSSGCAQVPECQDVNVKDPTQLGISDEVSESACTFRSESPTGSTQASASTPATSVSDDSRCSQEAETAETSNTKVDAATMTMPSDGIEHFTDVAVEVRAGPHVLVGGDGVSVSSNERPPSKPEVVVCSPDSDTDRESESVPGLINYFLTPETLSGENRYYCEACNSLQDAERATLVAESPEYLVLTLLRFSYDMRTHSRRKILRNVHIPPSLVLPARAKMKCVPPPPKNHCSQDCSCHLKVNSGVDTDDSCNAKSPLCKKMKHSEAELESDGFCDSTVPYVLTSVVVHSGMSSESGHYYSYARDCGKQRGGTRRCHRFSSNNNNLMPEGTAASPTGTTSDLADSSAPPPDKDVDDRGPPSCHLPCATASKVDQEEEKTEDESEEEQGEEWLLFNDSRVSFSSFGSVSGVTSRFPKDTAYVLIYRRRDRRPEGEGAACERLCFEPPLRKELMEAVSRDNKLYLQEQELEARTRALRTSSSSSSYHRRDDDDSHSPGSCGPGGGGSGFSSISRLVF
ncbi:ubiquitin carboxyl-terminal hydrolase 38 [Lampetra planeri]